MGSKKSKISENIIEGSERGNEGIAQGERLRGEAGEIKGLIDSIDTSMDEDDVAAVRNAEDSYAPAFRSAVNEQVTPRMQEMQNAETEAIQAAQQEGVKVRDAQSKLEQMGSVSEVGSDIANAGAEHMSSSAEQYDSQVETAQQIIEELQQAADEISSNIDSTFGS